MKRIKILILSLVISLLSLPSWSETIDGSAEGNGQEIYNLWVQNKMGERRYSCKLFKW